MDTGHHAESETAGDCQNPGTAEIEGFEVFLDKLGKRVRELRHEKGLKQEDFDDDTALGVTTRGVQAIEYGENNPKIYTLYKIAKRLGIDLKDIVDLG